VVIEPCSLIFVQHGDDSEGEAEIAQLEQQIDMCNSQITDLQQKLIDADQGRLLFIYHCYY